MDEKTALHTAARRFCQERFSEWMRNYLELQRKENWRVWDLFKPGWHYSDEAYRTFPRYLIHSAIQVEVERFTPDSITTLEELRIQLIRACDVAQARIHDKLKNYIAREALREEAHDFRAYIQVLGAADLIEIGPLPYRRVINEQESKRLWSQLKQSWGIEGGYYWFPLKGGPDPLNVIAFHTDYFEKMGGAKLLREALGKHGTSRVFQLQEFGPPEPEYEIELSIFEPAYGNGGEQYSTSQPADWVVYASHESSITIGGDWLADIFRKEWPDWGQHTYGGPFSTEDLRGTWDAS